MIKKRQSRNNKLSGFLVPIEHFCKIQQLFNHSRAARLTNASQDCPLCTGTIENQTEFKNEQTQSIINQCPSCSIIYSN
ncbi:MAG: hypothetical protein WCG01_00720 [bacterium]